MNYEFTRLKRWETPRSGPTRPSKGKKRPQAIRSRRKARQALLNRLQGRSVNDRLFIIHSVHDRSDMIATQYVGHMAHISHSFYVPFGTHDTKPVPFRLFRQMILVNLFHRSSLGEP